VPNQILIPDDDTLYIFKEKMDEEDSQITLEMIKRECGPGPFLGRKSEGRQITLIDPVTRKAVYRNTAGHVSINQGFVREFRRS